MLKRILVLLLVVIGCGKSDPAVLVESSVTKALPKDLEIPFLSNDPSPIELKEISYFSLRSVDTRSNASFSKGKVETPSVNHLFGYLKKKIERFTYFKNQDSTKQYDIKIDPSDMLAFSLADWELGDEVKWMTTVRPIKTGEFLLQSEVHFKANSNFVSDVKFIKEIVFQVILYYPQSGIEQVLEKEVGITADEISSIVTDDEVYSNFTVTIDDRIKLVHTEIPMVVLKVKDFNFKTDEYQPLPSYQDQLSKNIENSAILMIDSPDVVKVYYIRKPEVLSNLLTRIDSDIQFSSEGELIKFLDKTTDDKKLYKWYFNGRDWDALNGFSTIGNFYILNYANSFDLDFYNINGNIPNLGSAPYLGRTKDSTETKQFESSNYIIKVSMHEFIPNLLLGGINAFKRMIGRWEWRGRFDPNDIILVSASGFPFKDFVIAAKNSAISLYCLPKDLVMIRANTTQSINKGKHIYVFSFHRDRSSDL